MALQSMTLLADWNKLENRTNQILLSRYTVTDKSVHPLIETWNREYEEFSLSLELLSRNSQISRWKKLEEEINGATRVWRYTKIQLNNANDFFNKIIQSGLGEKIMVNGFIQTMYKLRMDGQLTTKELFLLDETLYALESLNNATGEFDLLFNTIVKNLKNTGELYLIRIRLMIIGLFSMAIVALSLSVLINRQLKNAQENRSLYLKRQRGQLLKSLCENSSFDNIDQFNIKKEGLGIKLSLEEPILPIILQIDDYSRFSHQLNLEEQNKVIGNLVREVEIFMVNEHMTCESFSFREDMIVLLSNTHFREENNDFLKRMKTNHEILLKNSQCSISMTVGSVTNEVIDLDNDFADLLEMSEYRFLLGKGAYIFSGSSQLSIHQMFHYPKDKERLFKESINSLQLESALNILYEMIGYGKTYGPRNMRRLLLRLTAALTNTVENLEQTYHIPSMNEVMPMMLQVQSPENIEGVRDILTEIINQIINSCLNKKEEKHDQTIMQIKEIISKEMNNLNLSADSIADNFNLTTSYINRLFKQHNSYSIAGYINKVRLDYSEELLRCTDKNVSEIAELSGFASPGTFFRLFKKKYGRTPKDYQRDIKIQYSEAE